MQKKVLILSFHVLNDTPETMARGNKTLAVHSGFLEEVMKELTARKIPVLSLDDVIYNRAAAPLSVSITFDDGYESDYRLAFPLLCKYNFPAAFFIPPDPLVSPALSWQQAREMIRDSRFIIGSHGISHSDMSRLSAERALKELKESREKIEDKLSAPVKYFAAPFGLYNKSTISLAEKSGYSAMLTTKTKINIPERFSFLLHRFPVYGSTSHYELFRWLDLSATQTWKKSVTTDFKFLIRRSRGAINTFSISNF